MARAKIIVPSLINTIKESFISKDYILNILYCNIRSVNSNIKPIMQILKETYPSIFLASESWLKEKDDLNDYKVPNYNLSIHNPRTKERSGGIAIYTRDDIKETILEKSRPDKFEYLLVQLEFNGFKTMVCICYNSHRVNSAKTIITGLDNILEKTKNSNNVIIAGDFNIDMLSETPRANKFKKYLANANLSFVPKIGTRPKLTGLSLLDLIIIKKPNIQRLSDTLLLPLEGISDHHLITTRFDMREPKLED